MFRSFRLAARFAKADGHCMTLSTSGRIPENIIREIRETCSIVDVVSEHVNLKKIGVNFKGLCPFHNEKTPSFFVNEHKKFFHCFGCGVSGDVFTFLEKHDRLSFQEAARMLAKKMGIAIPEAALSPRQRSEDREREELYAINAAAAHFYHALLCDDPRAEAARNYLHARGVSRKSMEANNLGFAPEGWDGLVRHVTRRNLSLEQTQKTGLLISKTKGRFYDRFRNRIMFPIISPAGHVLGFGGRIIGQGEPKYLNSPESPVYSKRHSLYGLNIAAGCVTRGEKIIVVEGYLDVITLHQAGIKNTVAALGTALTEQQIRLLKRYTSDIVTVFDADPSGQRAMVRSLEPFLRNSVPARLVVLPAGEDPDSYVRKHGAEAFVQHVEDSSLLLDFVIQQAIQKHNPTSPQGKVQACNDLVPLLAMIPDSLEQDLYIQNVAQRLMIREEHLYRRLGLTPLSPASGTRQAHPLPAGPSGESSGHAEKMILKLVLNHGGLIDVLERETVLDAFMDPALKGLGLRIIEARRQHGTIHVADIINDEPDPLLKKLLSEISFQDDIPADPAKALEDCIRDMRLKNNSLRLEKIKTLLKQADMDRNETLSLRYLREHQSLLQEKKDILQYKLNAQQR